AVFASVVDANELAIPRRELSPAEASTLRRVLDVIAALPLLEGEHARELVLEELRAAWRSFTGKSCAAPTRANPIEQRHEAVERERVAESDRRAARGAHELDGVAHGPEASHAQRGRVRSVELEEIDRVRRDRNDAPRGSELGTVARDAKA